MIECLFADLCTTEPISKIMKIEQARNDFVYKSEPDLLIWSSPEFLTDRLTSV